MLRVHRVLIAVTLALVVPQPSHAEKKYGPGVTDAEIKIGQTMPYSGSLSAFGTIGRAEAAYFEMVNAQGGVNGRRIRLISLDDDLTREHVMKQAASLKNFELPMLLPGIRINTSATDYDPIKQLQLMRFDGKEWVRFGEVTGP